MSHDRECFAGAPSRGNVWRLGPGHEVAVFVRDGVSGVAEFRNGTAALYAPSEWFTRGRACRFSRLFMDGDGGEPITDELSERIGRLHQRESGGDSFRLEVAWIAVRARTEAAARALVRACLAWRAEA